MHPFGFNVDRSVALLKEKDIRNYARSRVLLKSVIRKPYSAYEFCTLCKILSRRRVLFIKRTRTCYESHNAAGPYFIKRFGYEIVVDEKMLLIVLLIRNRIIAERHVADSHIEEAVGEISFLKALNGYLRVLIKLLRYPSGQWIEFHTVELRAAHIFRQHSEEVSNAAGRLKYVARFEAKAGKRRIHGLNDRRACIVRVER